MKVLKKNIRVLLCRGIGRFIFVIMMFLFGDMIDGGEKEEREKNSLKIQKVICRKIESFLMLGLSHIV